MHVEGDTRKAKASHVAVESYLREVDAPFTVFQVRLRVGGKDWG